ncbi:cysteine-tryptophan domain-containing zinc finger protein 7-like isoform X2 [Salvia splendens]|uniref:cysteine-tryptophan domain-containing zinc finger protein 7-like isoform X2 n=1 Tax=Salvia splendens TaxID=180675 RepID=UPI001C2651E1|nr:cysteine-tryptophan domain-containing zinc finger protein 7-like isoform X2 [Salvia splendens]
MLSVGSRDGRKRMGLGLDMEETELEEGEALGYQEGEDSTINPDIALSYIEEKVHKFLGHLQKDFEGGVSAENLGAKFGGYGSFLPTYQRSPSWSHTKSPAGAHNYESPRKPHTEDQRQNSLASSSASPSIRPPSASGKPLSVGTSLQGNGYLKSKHAKQSSLKSGTNKKSASDQRTLKVRIKVGSENLSAQKNAEIYSGLGLVVSPSSSMDDSPTTSGRQCGKLLGVPEASPTNILQIMTSYSEELLLSPLSEDLIHLTEKRKLRGISETKPGDKTSKMSGPLWNGSLSSRSNHIVTEQKKVDDYFTELPYLKNNAFVESNVSPLKKEENDRDAFGYEELVCNALKLPLLSSSQHIVSDPSKGMSPAAFAVKDGIKQEALTPFIEKEHLEGSAPAHDASRVEKLCVRSGSLVKASESEEGNLIGTVAACPQEDVYKAEKLPVLDQSESNASKGIKAHTAAEPPDLLKQLVTQKGGSVKEEGLESSLEKSSTGGKRKRKEAQNKDSEGAYRAKDELLVESSLVPKSCKSSQTNNSLISKNGTPDLQKEHEKPRDWYKDFFGDVEFENEYNESVSGEMTSSGRLKDSQLAGKRNLSKDHNMYREKHTGRNSEKTLEKNAKSVFRPAPPLENGPSSEAPGGSIPLVQEDWVLCDKCKTWRLLPLGTNPKNLPEKWLCRMLSWLPGMNRCSIPEEETTNALRALYHPVTSAPVPPSEGQDIRPNNSFMAMAGMNSAEPRPLAQEHHDVAVPTAPNSWKKKHGSAVAANSADIDGSTNSSNSRKKNLGMLGKVTKMNSTSNSPSVDESGQHMRQASMVLEKCRDAKAEKLSQVRSSDKGTNVKIMSKRDSDMEGSRSSKRIKSEELHCDDENWYSDNGGWPSTKAGHRSCSLSNNTSDNDPDKYNNPHDFNGESMKSIVSSMNVEMHVPSPAADGLLCSGKYDDEDPRKRITKENHGSKTHNEPVSNSGQHYLHSDEFREESSESEHRKEKKARLSKSGGKAMSGSKASVGADRKCKSIKDQYDGQLVNGTQAVDYLKSDMASANPSVAANSSSSKVSGSHRTKTNGQELKGSPVESVSSSPLRFPNADKVTSARKSLDGWTVFHESVAANPRRFPGSDDGGNDRTGLDKIDAVLTLKDHVDDVHNDQSGVHLEKSGKSSHSNDKAHASGSDVDKIKIKASDSRNDAPDHMHLQEEKSKSKRNKSDEKSGSPKRGEKFVSKKDTAGGMSSGSSRAPSQKKLGHDGQDTIRNQDKKHDLPQEHENEKLPKKSNQAELLGNGKSHSLPPLARIQTETAPVSGSQKENSLKGLAPDASDNSDAQNALNQRKKSENSNGLPMRHRTPNSHKVRDVDAPSPLRKDSSSQAANTILKEAKDLKHMADRLKNSGTSIGLYFEASLKFLHGASLLESGSSEATKHNELMHSLHIYSSTAKLCEFCAHDYEKSKDMGAAALAYKCMEVAYMRVIYSSHSNTSRDRAELQSALQIAAPGESPSSSASDVDNLNHQATADKAVSARVAGSPQVSGSHIITSRNRCGLLRVLNFAQDVTFAMEASRKSRIAFAAASSGLGETQKEGIRSLKNALDYSFQDVEGLLQFVRIAMDAISR